MCRRLSVKSSAGWCHEEAIPTRCPRPFGDSVSVLRQVDGPGDGGVLAVLPAHRSAHDRRARRGRPVGAGKTEKNGMGVKMKYAMLVEIEFEVLEGESPVDVFHEAMKGCAVWGPNDEAPRDYVLDREARLRHYHLVSGRSVS